MATFCYDCSIEMFGKDFGELAFAGDPDDFRSDLCEGCGWIWVNRDGRRLPTPPEDESLYPIALDPETLSWVSRGQRVVNNDLHSTAQSTDVEVTETP